MRHCASQGVDRRQGSVHSVLTGERTLIERSTRCCPILARVGRLAADVGFDRLSQRQPLYVLDGPKFWVIAPYQICCTSAWYNILEQFARPVRRAGCLRRLCRQDACAPRESGSCGQNARAPRGASSVGRRRALVLQAGCLRSQGEWVLWAGCLRSQGDVSSYPGVVHALMRKMP